MDDDRILLTLSPSAADEDYLTLGRTIAAQCAPGFAEARLEAEFDEEGANLRLACTLEGGAEAVIDLDPVAQVRIVQLLEPIRTKMAGEGEARWRKGTVTLRKGGHFRMDVEY